MMAYLVAIEGYTLPAMVKAMKAFLTGKVKRENMTFAPSAPEFADECRTQQLIMDAENRPRIEAKPETPQPKVSAEKLKLLKEATNGSLVARKKLAEMFPDNPIIASAAQDDNKEAAE
jgi:hypothetical protein